MREWPLRLVMFAAIGFAASCGSASGNPDAGLEAGSDGKTPPKKDAGPHDGHPDDGRPADSNPGDSPTVDVTTADGPPMDAGPSCHKIEGEASTLACVAPSGPAAGSVCAETGYVPGPCPSAGLTGCCTFSSGNTFCSYSSDGVSASMEKATCTSGGGTWSTSVP